MSIHISGGDVAANVTPNTTIRRAVKVATKKMLKDFQMTINPLKKFFTFMDETNYAKFMDYEAKLAAANTVSDPMARNQPTPTAIQLGYRRRMNRLAARNIHVSMPRADAKTLGKGNQAYQNDVVQAAKASLERGAFEMMLELIESSYVESPLSAGIGSEPKIAAVPNEVAFPLKYRHMLVPDGAESTYAASQKYRAPLAVDALPYLTASLLNFQEIGTNSKNINSGSGQPGDKKCLVIINASAYASFRDYNKEYMANKDWFGKSMMVGPGEVFDLQNYGLLVVPDIYFPDYKRSETIVASGASTGQVNFADTLTFPNPTNWDEYDTRLLTAVQGSGNNNQATAYTDPNNTHRALVIDPRAMSFYIPTQLQVDQEYYDKDLSMERFYFGQQAIEGIRHWDGLVRSINFTGSKLTGAYVGS